MAIDIQIIASRLAQMRDTLAYNLSEVASKVGISESRLKELESGQFKPSGDEVLILADFYKCNFISLVDKDVPSPANNTDPLFRRYGSSFSVEDRRATQDFLFLCQREHILEKVLGRDKEKVSFTFSPTGSFYKGHGKDAASELRSTLNYTSSEVPLNIYNDFRKIGIHVFRRRLKNNDISGLYINDAIAGHCVLINYDEDVYRQRFSVAHEVAHAIFDSSDNYVLSFKSESKLYGKSDLMEIRANNFASNYLVPMEFIERMPSVDRNNAKDWSSKLQVSTFVLAIALENSGKVGKDEASVIKALRVDGQSKVDPEIPNYLSIKQRDRRQYFLELGLSAYYVDLCFDAYDNGLVSVGYLVECLGVDYSDFGQVCSLYGRTIKHGL